MIGFTLVILNQIGFLSARGSNGLGTARANLAVFPNLRNTKSLLSLPDLTVTGEDLVLA
jgi:hypothetical protein